MVGIVYATHREASPFLLQTAAVLLTDRPFSVFAIDATGQPACMVVISGMGKVAASIAATYLVMAHHVSVLISAGLCGQLTKRTDWSAGDILRVSTAVEGDCDRLGHAEKVMACNPEWFGDLKSARLVTCDRPVFDAKWRDRLAGIAEIADMEGAAVARVAKLYGIPCAQVKGISDAADQNGRQDVVRRIDWISTRIADAIVREVALQTPDRHS